MAAIVVAGGLNAQTHVQIDELPEFPGGNDSMHRFLQGQLKYPDAAKDSFIQGTVVVSAIIEKDGSLSNTKVDKGVSPELDAEALRVINSMPRWKPAKKDGTPIRTKYIIPIRFDLDLEEPEGYIMDSLTAPNQKEVKVTIQDTEDMPVEPPPVTEEETFVIVEDMPQFPGGNEGMFEYIEKNYNVPNVPKVSGRIMVSFVVEPDSSLSNIQVVRGLSPEHDKEAIRVIQSMPPWKPGKQRNKTVRVKVVVPILIKEK